MNAADKNARRELIDHLTPWLTRANVLIVALVLLVIGSVLYGRSTGYARAKREDASAVAHVADSVAKALAPKLAHTDTLVVRDTVRVRRTVARLDTLRDTLLLHLTDTVRVKEFVTRAESVAHACTELATDCAAFRSFAQQRFAADSQQITALRALAPKPSRFGIKTGAALGAAFVVTVLHFTK